MCKHSKSEKRNWFLIKSIKIQAAKGAGNASEKTSLIKRRKMETRTRHWIQQKRRKIVQKCYLTPFVSTSSVVWNNTKCQKKVDHLNLVFLSPLRQLIPGLHICILGN